MSDSKQTKLYSLTEDEFRTQVVIPLLRRMDYKDVRHRHGPDEYGKDITCQYIAKAHTENIAVIAKVGDISGESRKRRTTKTLDEIKSQISKAWDIPLDDATVNSEVNVSRIMVWTSGKIKNNVHTQVRRDTSGIFRNVTFVDGATTIDWLNDHYNSFWTINDYFISTYFESVKTRYEKLEELLVLGASDESRQLSSVFVPPRLELFEMVRSKQARQEKLPLRKYPFSRLLQIPNQNTALVGGFGTGKSTALRRVLLEIIEKNVGQLPRYQLPIFIRFRDLDLDKHDAIADGLAHEFELLSTSEEATDFSELLEKGDVVALLDGLDELESEENIVKGVILLNRFIDKYEKTRVIFASRSLEVLETTNLLSRFAVYRILNLDYSQIQTFIRRWFQDREVDGEQLVKLISNPVTFTTLPLTPLSLALIAIVYRSGITDLPMNLTELFDKYIEIALGRWDRRKGIQLQFEWQIKKGVMQYLAWVMAKENRMRVSALEIEELASAKLDEIGIPMDSRGLVSEILDRSGLLMPCEDGGLMFKHHSFLSYFAGQELTAQPNALDILETKFYDIAWSRIVFFACGIKRDDNSFLKRIVDNVEIPQDNLLYFATQLGLVTQASFLSSVELKCTLIERSIDSFVLAWDELVGRLNDASLRLNSPRHVPQYKLLEFICLHIHISLGSPMLRLSLEKVVRERLRGYVTPSSSNELGLDANLEWFNFLLAMACLYAEAYQGFASALENGQIRNPLLLRCLELHVEVSMDDEEKESDEHSMLLEQQKRLGRRLKGRSGEISTIIHQTPDPIRLPETNSSR